MGMRKPEVESFKAILKDESLVADETLFIDDTPKNVEGARKAGLQGILLEKPKTIFDLEL